MSNTFMSGGRGGGGVAGDGFWPIRGGKTKGARKTSVKTPSVTPTPAPKTDPKGPTSFAYTTSEYGRFIPLVFGSDLLTGNVFWSKPFVTNTVTVGDEVFSYGTVSFALGLCEGEIDYLLRLWVGEKLVIDNTMKVDANGVPIPGPNGLVLSSTFDITDPDSPLRSISPAVRQTKVTVFTGSETQVPADIMIDTNGYSNTPAYRGMAYVLFENLIVSESTVPAILAEITANSNPLYPRLYGGLPDPEVFFDQPRTNILAYDPSYDIFTMGAEDTGSNSLIPDGRGVVVFNGNSLAVEVQAELELTQGVNLLFNADHYVLSTGKQLFIPKLGNVMTVLNPFTGFVENTWGPTTILGRFTPSGGSQFWSGHAAFVETVDGDTPTDVIFAVDSGAATMTHREFALVSIDANNQFEFHYRNNSLLDKDGNLQSVALRINNEFYAKQPTFFDGTQTRGHHIFVAGGNVGEQVSIDIYRVTVDGAGTVLAPSVGLLLSIPLDQIGGSGIVHEVNTMFIDPADNCLVIGVEVSSGRADQLVKVDPYAGTVLWNTPCDLWDTSLGHSNQSQVITNSTYVTMSAQGVIQKFDLKTGERTILVEDIEDQQLPLPFGNLFQRPFYNGKENSLTYISDEPGKQLVKVFLERGDRNSVPVSEIVSLLLQRVGISETEIDLNDLSTLQLKGYTINSETTVRSVIADLSQVFRFDVIESNGKIVYKTRGNPSVATIPHYLLGNVDAQGFLSEEQENDFGRTRKINLTYKDIDREYDQNVQSVFFPKYTNTKFDDDGAIDVSVPVVLDAPTARKLAEILLYSKIVYEKTFETRLPIQYSYLDPGDVVTLDLTDGAITARIRDFEIGADHSIRARLTREDEDIYTDQANLFGIIGQFTASSLTPEDPRVDPFVLSLPFRSYEEAEVAGLNNYMFITLLSLRGTTVPDVNIALTLNNTQTLVVPNVITFPTWGFAQNALPGRGSFYSTDYTNVLRVRMISGSGASISSVSKDTLMSIGVTCNLAYLNGELIQFETATDLGGGVWEFSGLQRCRLGTEDKMFSHVAGEKFILLGDATGELDEGSFTVVPISPSLGAEVAVRLDVETKNPFQPTQYATFAGLTLRPWSVASFKAVDVVGGDLVLTWKRRSRYDGEYIDDGAFETVPLTEGTERYTIYVYRDPETFDASNPATYLRTASLTSPEFIYSAAELLADNIDRENDALYCRISYDGTAAGFEKGVELQFTIERKPV